MATGNSHMKIAHFKISRAEQIRNMALKTSIIANDHNYIQANYSARPPSRNRIQQNVYCKGFMAWTQEPFQAALTLPNPANCAIKFLRINGWSVDKCRHTWHTLKKQCHFWGLGNSMPSRSWGSRERVWSCNASLILSHSELLYDAYQ